MNDREASVRFYTEVMGFGDEGEDGPFSVIRVSPDTTLQLAPWGTEGGDHLAFALSPEEYAAAFDRVRAANVPYGDSFHDVGNVRVRGRSPRARGLGPTLCTCSTPTGTWSSCATTDSIRRERAPRAPSPTPCRRRHTASRLRCLRRAGAARGSA